MHTTVGDIDLAYNTLGEPTDPPVVLISGLGAQLIAWDDAFCQQLVDRGLFVIRFDNRDVGLSSHLADRPRSDPSAEPAGAAPAASYTLAQMAADTAGLIDKPRTRLCARGRDLVGRDNRTDSGDRAPRAGLLGQGGTELGCEEGAGDRTAA
jgi:pimeloyl-ACP methyl ester carboxylesterase